MIQIVRAQDTGKTHTLLKLAKQTDGIIVCSNPSAMAVKAQSYGIYTVEILSYEDFFSFKYLGEPNRKIYIDDGEAFLDRAVKSRGGQLTAYTMNIEE